MEEYAKGGTERKSFVFSGGFLVPAKRRSEERGVRSWWTSSLSEGHIFLLARSPLAPITIKETPLSFCSVLLLLQLPRDQPHPQQEWMIALLLLSSPLKRIWMRYTYNM
uniref:Uncharacterized protein n=1 Tax=Amphimedon queenslandica TaxID=400682 RepID=A0A1X7TYA2_AMPQE